MRANPDLHRTGAVQTNARGRHIRKTDNGFAGSGGADNCKDGGQVQRKARFTADRVAVQQLNPDVVSVRTSLDPALVRDLVESYIRLGDVRGEPYGANLGDTAGALDCYRKAQALIEAEAMRHPTDRAMQLELAQMYLKLNRLLNREGRTNESLAVVNRAIQTLSALTALVPGNARYLEELARAYAYLSESEEASCKKAAGDGTAALRARV